MSKKLDRAIELAQLHWEVIDTFGIDIETDVFPFIQENWYKGHKLFSILEQAEYEKYIPYVMNNFTLKQINQFFEELSICFLVD